MQEKDRTPLEYEAPRPASHDEKVSAAVRGFFVGVGGMIVYCMFLVVPFTIPRYISVATSPTTMTAVLSRPSTLLPLLLISAPFVAAIGGVVATRGKRSQTYYLGMLSSVGVFLLLAGLCALGV